MPKLILQSLQVNIRGGRLPDPEANGRRYLKIPLGALEGAPWNEGDHHELKSAKELVAEATAEVETLSADAAVNLIGDPNVVLVDVRESDERRKTDVLKGSVHASRGFLEFHADPNSPNPCEALEQRQAVGALLCFRQSVGAGCENAQEHRYRQRLACGR